MAKLKIIYSLNDFYPRKLGWTYFLLSKDKRYLKIGKTTADLSTRIKAINNDQNYKGYDFSLLLAFVDASYEKQFHHFFRGYRACFNWLKPKQDMRNLSADEVWSIAVKSSKKKYGVYRKSYVYQELGLYSQKTIVELFKLPPRKIVPKLIPIITAELAQIEAEKGTKKRCYLVRSAREIYG
ncbi:GIY-YIG nuclease family protein [Vibrio parahaemolyticus]